MNPYALLTLTALFWAGNAISGKMADGVISPVSLNFARWFLTCVAFYVLARPHLKSDWPMARRHLPPRNRHRRRLPGPPRIPRPPSPPRSLCPTEPT